MSLGVTPCGDHRGLNANKELNFTQRPREQTLYESLFSSAMQ